MPSEVSRIPKKLGETVRHLREAKGISQIVLAEKADLAHNYVGEIERAEKLASIETVVRLAKGFGMTGAQLLARAGL